MATPKILLVNDDTAVNLELAKACRARGWEVLFASDGVQGTGFARRHEPDVVVLKLALPAGGGISLLRRLRQNVHTAGIPVIALSREERPDATAAAATAAGAQAAVPLGTAAADVVELIAEQIGEIVSAPTAPRAALVDEARLEAVDETGLMGATGEPDLDVVTRIASRQLGVPMAMLCLVGRNRQFFVSHVGLPERWATERETPLSYSFCQWVVSSGGPVIVEDASEHPLLSRSRAVSEIGVAAYAGVPMYAPSGEPLGALSGIHTRPHEWSDDDRTVLSELATVARGLTGVGFGCDPEGDEDRWKLSDQPWEPVEIVDSVAAGVAAGTRLLYRDAAPLDEADRRWMLSTVERQSQCLCDIVEERKAGA